MEDFLKAISKNPTSDKSIPAYSKDKAEIQNLKNEGQEQVSRMLIPSRLTTAWLMLEDPLMLIAGGGYKSSEVRDRTFDLQKEALANLRGNRKLTKAKMGDALSALKPTTDQTKVLAAILLALKQIQTVCFDEQAKTVWTMPEDIRAWSTDYKTLWVDSRCEQMLDGQLPSLGFWLSEREAEGWKISWPIADGSLEEMKRELGAVGITPTPKEFGGKVLKDDWAACLGRYQAYKHLSINKKDN